MELKTLLFQDLHFPSDEWQWLRSPVRYTDAPDSFLWATTVNSKCYAWSNKGTTLLNGFTDQKLSVLHLPNRSDTEAEAFGLYIKTSFAAQTPHDVEWVNALSVLDQRRLWDPVNQGLPPFWADALIEAGLEPHLGTLSQRSRYLMLTLDEKQHCYNHRWDPSAFDLTSALPNSVREAFLQSIKQYKFSANQTKESSNFVLLLVKKFGEKSALNILSQKHKGFEELRLSLFRLAQPELARLSEERISKLRKLHLPPRTSVFGDPSFESSALKITHNPRSSSDWEAFKEWVERPEVLEKIKDLLDLYQ